MPPPSPNPTSLVRWEDSSSLEHACWACANKANSPKALHSCYGIHSMPCLAYHPTMHAVGAAHRCSACIAGREIHEGRHREVIEAQDPEDPDLTDEEQIAQLIADYHAAGEDDNTNKDQNKDSDNQWLRINRVLQERPLNIPIRQQQIDHNNESDHDHDHEQNAENLSSIETASITTSSDDTNLLKLTKAERRERKRSLKAQKLQEKAVKTQAKHHVRVTSHEVQQVNRVLHGDQAETQLLTHPLATDKTIEDVITRNKGFVKQLQCHMRELQYHVAQGRKEDKERKRHKKRVSEGLIEDIESEAVINAILVKLGVHPAAVSDSAHASSNNHDAKSHCHHNAIKHKKHKSNPSSPAVKNTAMLTNKTQKATKQQMIIVMKLRDAIKDDLEKHENELKQTYIRAGAFFRYAGRQVFERMTEIASRIDVQTGEEWDKKFKRENHDLVAGPNHPNDVDDERGLEA